MLKPRSTRQS